MAQRILIIEDDNPSREFLNIALAEEQYEVMSVGNGQSALDIVRIFRPHLILLDMRMPGIDGEAFIELYWEMTGCRAPIIGLSASRQMEIPARTHGVTDFLVKPINLDDLLCCVKSHLQTN